MAPERPGQPSLPAPGGNDSPEQISFDLAAVARLDAVPDILSMVCSLTGMGFAAVARVTDETWTACAVSDTLNFGLEVGGQLDLRTTLCFESRASMAPIVIDHASKDPVYCNHATPRLYQIESYISVPIVLPNGRYFGNLCALDPAPATVSDARTIALFEGFARLIARQLEGELAQEEDRTALADAQAAGELRDQFIAILGHDLRNPLQAVYATGELLERRLKGDPALSAMAGRIKTNVRRMSALIDDVLDFARGRLGGGIGVALAEETDIETPITQAIEELQDGHSNREIIAAFNLTKPVCCDARRIQQLVSNLVANALTHGAAATPVKIAASTPGDFLVVEVWNQGEPIPGRSIDSIFQPFKRETMSRDRQGLGLGLHICSQIVRAHGGTISVRSTSAEGTLFTATLPLACSSNSRTQEMAAP